MSNLALWTWIAAGVLIAVPPVIFALFLRDARQMFRDIGVQPGADAPNAADPDAA